MHRRKRLKSNRLLFIILKVKISEIIIDIVCVHFIRGCWCACLAKMQTHETNSNSISLFTYTRVYRCDDAIFFVFIELNPNGRVFRFILFFEFNFCRILMRINGISHENREKDYSECIIIMEMSVGNRVSLWQKKVNAQCVCNVHVR